MELSLPRITGGLTCRRSGVRLQGGDGNNVALIEVQDPGDPGNGLRRPFVISLLKSKEQKPSQASWYKPHSTQKRCWWASLRPSLPDPPLLLPLL